MGTHKGKGFTLVEIAIVLVIIGLLLGGILKGQELINNARVRAIADRSNSLKAAWYAFIDRYQALPGDFTQATRYVPNATQNGTGNGFLYDTESPLVFNHLTGSGLLRCTVCTDSVNAPSTQNSIVNLYGGVTAIFSNSAAYLIVGGPNDRRRLQALTGPRIPSNIINEVDRKIDDGLPHKGDFVYTTWDALATTGATSGSDTGREQAGYIASSGCVTIADTTVGGSIGTKTIALQTDLIAPNSLTWRDVRSNPPTVNDCGAGSFF